MLKCLSIPIKKAVIFHKANFSVIFKKEPETHFWERRKGTWIVLCPSRTAHGPCSLSSSLSRARSFAGPGGLRGEGFCQWTALSSPVTPLRKLTVRTGRVLGNWEGQSVGRQSSETALFPQGAAGEERVSKLAVCDTTVPCCMYRLFVHRN